MAEHPDITVMLDVVPYATIDEQLPIQVETGEGPDLARITNFGAYSGKLLDLRGYLQDAAYLRSQLPGPNPGSPGLWRLPGCSTRVTGPYVNKTLFDQAGVEMPGEGATWEEWTEVTKAGRRSHRHAVRHLHRPHRSPLCRPGHEHGRHPDRC